jgi:hypothetical protein
MGLWLGFMLLREMVLRGDLLVSILLACVW